MDVNMEYNMTGRFDDLMPGNASANSTADSSPVCPTKPAPSETYRLYRVIVDIYIVGFLCLIGFIGNALTIAVLRRDRDKKNTTNWLLQALAFADTLYLLACVFIQTIKGIQMFTDWLPILDIALPYMEPYVWAFASIAQTITVWLVMLVTIDRYIAICKPLKTQLRDIQRAKLAVTSIIILAIIYNIPRFLERKIVFDYNHCLNITIVKTTKTDLRENNIYFLVYKTIMYFIFRAVGPLLTLLILNIRLIRALQEVRRKHRDLTKSNKHRENITLVLVVVVSVFIICEIPDLVLRIIFTLNDSIPSMTINIWALRYYNAITNMLLTVNSSINFLIYCLIGQKFRNILQTMCLGQRRANLAEASESEPLTTRVTHVQASKNGTLTHKAKDGDVSL